MPNTVEQDLDIAKAALRRIAGATAASRSEPGSAPLIVAALEGTKVEAHRALDKLFLSEFERQAVDAEGLVGE